MKFYPVKTPNFIQLLFKNLVWGFSTDKKEIYLTFDDGPTPEITEWTLDQLKKHNAKATFFCIGKNITDYPNIYQKIITEGHSVGNHTYNHLNGWKTKTAEYLENIHKTECLLKQKSNQKLFRPPYGKIKKEQIKALLKKDYKIIMWSVLSADFDTTVSKEKCLKTVLKNTTNGNIIVFHDSVKAFDRLRYTLPKVLQYYSKKGYTFREIK